MWTELHWINGPWPAKLAVFARPRGGDWLADEMASWKRQGDTNLVIHCRQGIGRSGLAACLLAKTGLSPGAAIEMVSAARGVPVPETKEQRAWIDRYAGVFSNRK
jgi:protein-tyrosine phosphatase